MELNDDKVMSIIQDTINQIGHFPTETELRQLKKRNLASIIYRNGGFPKFRKIMGYEYLKKPKGFWSDETIIKELKLIVNKLGYFPTSREINTMKRYDLVQIISQHGGMAKFRKIMGYKLIKKPSKWSEERIKEELKIIINQNGQFPTQNILEKLNREDLCVAIGRNGGLNKFRIIMGYSLLRKSDGYWTDNTIIKELESIIKKLGYFPTWEELLSTKRYDLLNAIGRNGGISKLRQLMGHNILKNVDGYWSDENIIKRLKEIITKLNHFPSSEELKSMKENSLVVMMVRNGGINKFRELLGYSVSMHEEYISKLHFYTGMRGRQSENIVREIISNYCFLHNFPPPQYNKKLARGNVIEFVCNTNKKIGIDVTNTREKQTIKKKWTKKQYHLYLDELWIVVFSNVFSDKDYTHWNNESPDNVKIMSIHQFLSEIDYSLSKNMKDKIDKYCSCTFHTKEELMTHKKLPDG